MSNPDTWLLDTCPTQRGCCLPALLPCLNSCVIDWLHYFYFVDCSPARCANRWETGWAVLGRSGCSANHANAQARPGLWKLLWKTRHNWMDFNLAPKKILCQQPSIRLSGNSHPPAGFIQGLCWFGLRLDWHLRASIVALKERLEQSWQEAELPQRKRRKRALA